MRLKDVARRLPDEIWTVFEPILPPGVWCGLDRKPKGNRDCFHALPYVLVSGIPWGSCSRPASPRPGPSHGG